MGYEGRDYRRSRGQDYGYRDRDRDEGRYGRTSGYDNEDRGFFDRAGDEVRSWFGDEEAERRRRQDEQEYERRYGRGNRWSSAYDNAPGGYSSRGGGYWGERPNSSYDTGGYGYRDAGYAGFGNAGRDEYTPYRGGTYRENSTDRHDPNYHEWRSREIEALDRDYRDYRRENQSRFENDFGSWRTNRQGQRRQLENVREHQDVVGSDGAHVGTVDHVRGDRILLTKGDDNAGGHHHSIPCSWISKISDKIELNRTSAAAQQAWKDEERRGAFRSGYDDDSDGPHILNRSFAGTY
jgi:hypothetical protein